MVRIVFGVTGMAQNRRVDFDKVDICTPEEHLLAAVMILAIEEWREPKKHLKFWKRDREDLRRWFLAEDRHLYSCQVICEYFDIDQGMLIERLEVKGEIQNS